MDARVDDLLACAWAGGGGAAGAWLSALPECVVAMQSPLTAFYEAVRFAPGEAARIASMLCVETRADGACAAGGVGATTVVHGSRCPHHSNSGGAVSSLDWDGHCTVSGASVNATLAAFAPAAARAALQQGGADSDNALLTEATTLLLRLLAWGRVSLAPWHSIIGRTLATLVAIRGDGVGAGVGAVSWSEALSRWCSASKAAPGAAMLEREIALVQSLLSSIAASVGAGAGSLPASVFFRLLKEPAPLSLTDTSTRTSTTTNVAEWNARAVAALTVAPPAPASAGLAPPPYCPAMHAGGLLARQGLCVVPAAIPADTAAALGSAMLAETARVLRAVLDSESKHAATETMSPVARLLQPAAGFREVVCRSRGRFDVRNVPELRAYVRAEMDKPSAGAGAGAGWLRAVRAVLGPDAVLVFAGGVVCLPGAGAQEWHKDGGSLFPSIGAGAGLGGPHEAWAAAAALHACECTVCTRAHANITTSTSTSTSTGCSSAGFDALPCHALNVFVPLTALHAGNGPTQFIPASHRNSAGGVAASAAGAGAGPAAPGAHPHCVPSAAECAVLGSGAVVTPLGAAGDAVLMDYRLLHRGAAYDPSTSTSTSISAAGDAAESVRETAAAAELAGAGAGAGVAYVSACVSALPHARPLAFFTFARPWWRDHINYPQESVFAAD